MSEEDKTKKDPKKSGLRILASTQTPDSEEYEFEELLYQDEFERILADMRDSDAFVNKV